MYFLISQAFAISATVAPGDDIAAVVSTLGPGDVITFTGGTYELENTLRITEAIGEPGNPVILTSGNTGAVLKAIEGDTVFVLADSQNVTIENLIFEGGELWEEEGGGGVVLSNSSGVTFRNNIVRNVRGDLLRLSGDTSDLVINDNELKLTSAGTGIYVGCGDGSCWMSNSEIFHNLVHDTGTEENNRSGIYLEDGCQGNVIHDNTVFNTTSLGIRVESTQLGDHNTVEGNAVWSTRSHGIEVLGEAVVRNNVVFETGGNGIRSTDAISDFQNVRITYNTVALTGDWGVYLDGWSDKPGMVFSSNVIANITGRALDYNDDIEESGTDNLFSNNVVSGLVEGVDPALQVGWFSAGAGTRDFVDVVNWNFYPDPDSDLVGNGDPAGDAWVPPNDFNGSVRNGEFPTIGALEYVGPGNPGWVIQEDFKGEGDIVGPDPNDPGNTGGCCSKSDDASQAWIVLPFLGLFAGRRRRRD